MGRKRKSREEDESRPLWGDHWTLGSFWDALMVVRAKIKTASAALVGLETGDSVVFALDDVADELARLSERAKEELESWRG